MLAGVRDAFNVQTGVYDWNCDLNENGDLGTAFQDPAAKLFEGSLDGQASWRPWTLSINRTHIKQVS